MGDVRHLPANLSLQESLNGGVWAGLATLACPLFLAPQLQAVPWLSCGAPLPCDSLKASSRMDL